jgi:hypothetical protein
MYTKLLLGNLKGRDHLEDLGVDGRMKLKWIVKRYEGVDWIGLDWIGLDWIYLN